jgi:hypothetical protein
MYIGDIYKTIAMIESFPFNEDKLGIREDQAAVFIMNKHSSK